MLDIPGYRVLGTIRATSSNVLFQAVREADGLPVIIKTPLTPTPGPIERERYRREFGILQRLSSALAVQLLGGRLTLESEGLGKGAVATLELPLS